MPACYLELTIVQMSNGNAVTSVVTEYRLKTDGRDEKFRMEAEYFDDDGRLDMLKELAWSYRRPTLVDPAGLRTQEEKDEYERFKAEHKVAKSALQAAFGHHEGLWQVCDRRSESAITEIADELFRWSNDLGLPSNGKWEMYSNSPTECRRQLRARMEDKLWPFTKVIRYS